MNECNYESLVNRIKLGEEDAFYELYSEFYVGLYVHAKRFLISRESSEDVVQDVFLRLWERRECLDIRESIGHYLFQTVRNSCLNQLKHLNVVQKFELTITDQYQQAGDYFSITQENGQSICLAHELENRLNTAIEELPEQCRIIFRMSRFERLKNREIADKRGVTINTVQKQISIALEKLREALYPYLKLIVPVLTIWDLLR